MSSSTAEILSSLGVPPTAKLVQYCDLLLEWNEKVNLTGAKNIEELVTKHIADAWLAFQAIGGVPEHIVDVGSGGGIPGIPLAIMAPNTRVWLVERRQRKASALDSMVSKLELDDRVKVFPVSLDQISNLRDPQEFWFRGFLPGPKLAAYLSEAFPSGKLGRLILMKGPGWHQELAAIQETPKIRDVWLERFLSSAEIPYELPNGAGTRLLVLV